MLAECTASLAIRLSILLCPLSRPWVSSPFVPNAQISSITVARRGNTLRTPSTLIERYPILLLVEDRILHSPCNLSSRELFFKR